MGAKDHPRRRRGARTIRLLLLGLLLVVALAGLMSQPVAAASSNVSILLVIDSSGSMNGPDGNDPDNLRRVSAQLIAGLLDPGDELGMVEFSSNIVSSLEVTAVRSGDTKRDLITRLNDVGTKPGGDTNMGVAFEAGCRLLAKATGTNRYVIFLTDGVPTASAGRDGSQEQEYVRQQAAACNARIVPVALYGGNPATPPDPAFLRTLPGAGGQVKEVRKAIDLPNSFLAIFGELADRWVPDPTFVAGQDFAFETNSLMLSVSFIFVGKDAPCDGQPACLPAVRGDYYGGKGFAVVTAPKPSAGTIRIPKEQSNGGTIRVLVHSRLRLRLFAPREVQPVGRPVQLEIRLLQEDDTGNVLTRITGAQTRATLAIVKPDGTTASGDIFDKGDGIFRYQFNEVGAPGIYRLTMTAQQENIPITGQAEFELRPFPTIMIDSPASGQAIALQPGKSTTIRAKLVAPPGEPNALTVAKITEATISFVSEDGQPIVPLALKPAGSEAIGDIQLDAKVGKLMLQVAAKAEYAGVPYSISSDQVGYQREVRPVVELHNPPSTLNFGTNFTVGDLGHVALKMRAWSTQLVKLTATATGVPGLRVTVRPDQIAPGVESTVDLALDGGTGLVTGQTYRGVLVLDGGGVPIDPAIQFPFEFTLGQPSITYTMPGGQRQVDFGKAFQVSQFDPVPLDVTINGNTPVPIRATLQGITDLTVTVDPTGALPAKTAQRVYLRLMPTGGQLAPRKYSGTITVESTQPGLLSAQIPVQFEIVEPTVKHTLPSRLTQGAITAGPISFQVETNLPDSRPLSVAVVDQNGKPLTDVEAQLVGTSMLQPHTGAPVTFQIQVHQVGQPGWFSAWQQSGYIELSAGPGVTVQGPEGTQAAARAAFSLTEPARARQGATWIKNATVGFSLFLFVLTAILLGLYVFASGSWLGWRYVNGRNLAVTLRPVMVNERGDVLVDQQGKIQLSDGDGANPIVLAVGEAQCRVFGLPVGQGVPIQTNWPTERFLSWLGRKIWPREHLSLGALSGATMKFRFQVGGRDGKTVRIWVPPGMDGPRKAPPPTTDAPIVTGTRPQARQPRRRGPIARATIWATIARSEGVQKDDLLQIDNRTYQIEKIEVDRSELG